MSRQMAMFSGRGVCPVDGGHSHTAKTFTLDRNDPANKNRQHFPVSPLE
jgi:hypothetical protein